MLLALAFLPQLLLAQVLPPPPAPPGQQRELSAGVRLFVRGYRFEGNHAFSSKELARVAKPYTGRELGTEDMEQLRRAITLYYVSHGYVNSGALIPDQNPKDGIVLIRLVEGKLTKIDLHGNKWLSDNYIRSRVERWSEPPLNLPELQEGLQLLRQNPNVTQINAELKPGSSLSQGVLDLRVQDHQPFRLGLQFDNQRPPSVGAMEISALAADMNLTGNSDPLQFRYGIVNSGPDGLELSGVDNLDGSYELPFTRFDTSVGIHGSRLNTSLIEDPFVDLHIKSLTQTIGFGLRQPLYQSPRQQVNLSLGFDHRQNQTWLMDQPFNISPGAVDGKMVVSVLRFAQEWVNRGPNRVLALRSTFNFGLPVWDATNNGNPNDPNGQFFYWLGQGQYVQRLFNTQNELVLRLSGQWTDEPLLALEQLSVGGYYTVRGYLENQLVRDRGIISSAEFRVPVLFQKSGAPMLSLAPFFDFGGAWNIRQTPNPSTIYSVGVGVLFALSKYISADVYWGYRLRDVTIPSQSGVQGYGVGFKINFWAF
jgi:hemolysin activation/secretion protein